MSAYNFGIQDTRDGYFYLYWTVDHKYPSSRLRFPREHRRSTDREGAERFAKKHGLSMPSTPQPNVDEGDGK